MAYEAPELFTTPVQQRTIACCAASGRCDWNGRSVGLRCVSSGLRVVKQRRLVPVEGIEPTLLAEHDFESCASTSSATRAWRMIPKSLLADLIREVQAVFWPSCAPKFATLYSRAMASDGQTTAIKRICSEDEIKLDRSDYRRTRRSRGRRGVRAQLGDARWRLVLRICAQACALPALS